MSHGFWGPLQYFCFLLITLVKENNFFCSVSMRRWNIPILIKFLNCIYTKYLITCFQSKEFCDQVPYLDWSVKHNLQMIHPHEIDPHRLCILYSGMNTIPQVYHMKIFEISYIIFIFIVLVYIELTERLEYRVRLYCIACLFIIDH